LVAINEYDGFNVLPKDIRDKEFELLRNFVKIPEIYAFNDKNWRETELLYKNCDYRIVGCMIKNIKTKERTKIRNNNYENVRKLKGNSNKLQYQYYWLRKHKKIQEYLRYFPEHNDSFMEFQNALHSWTIELLKNYTNCFIKKEKRLKEYPFQFRIHMYNLHQLYLNKKFNNNNERFYINKEVVINHINDLDAAALMYLINFKNSD
jgi:hypothetical protein